MNRDGQGREGGREGGKRETSTCIYALQMYMYTYTCVYTRTAHVRVPYAARVSSTSCPVWLECLPRCTPRTTG